LAVKFLAAESNLERGRELDQATGREEQVTTAVSRRMQRRCAVRPLERELDVPAAWVLGDDVSMAIHVANEPHHRQPQAL